MDDRIARTPRRRQKQKQLTFEMSPIGDILPNPKTVKFFTVSRRPPKPDALWWFTWQPPTEAEWQSHLRECKSGLHSGGAA